MLPQHNKRWNQDLNSGGLAQESITLYRFYMFFQAFVVLKATTYDSNMYIKTIHTLQSLFFWKSKVKL